MSRLDLAKAVNFYCGQESIRRYESGENNPNIDTVLRIAAALNISPAKLTEEDVDAQG